MTKAKSETTTKTTTARKRRSSLQVELNNMTATQLVTALKDAEAKVEKIKTHLKDLFEAAGFKQEPQLPTFSNNVGRARGFEQNSDQVFGSFDSTNVPQPIPGNNSVPSGSTNSNDNKVTAPLAAPIMTDYYAADDPLNMGVEEELSEISTITNTDQPEAIISTETLPTANEEAEGVLYQ